MTIVQCLEYKALKKKSAFRAKKPSAAQWSIGVTKPIHEISNIQTNMNFLEAFEIRF